MNDETITIGERHDWGDPEPFGIAAVDQRQHLYIIGKTGSGKTTLLRNLIVQHIALGHGVGVIDPTAIGRGIAKPHPAKAGRSPGIFQSGGY